MKSIKKTIVRTLVALMLFSLMTTTSQVGAISGFSSNITLPKVYETVKPDPTNVTHYKTMVPTGCRPWGEKLVAYNLETGSRTIVLNSQEEVDDFVGNGYKEIYGNILISGSYITDLSTLSCLEIVHGSIRILYTSNLEDLHGLENLREVDGNLIIYSNQHLSDIDALSSLEKVGGVLTVQYNAVCQNDAADILSDVEVTGRRFVSYNEDRC